MSGFSARRAQAIGFGAAPQSVGGGSRPGWAFTSTRWLLWATGALVVCYFLGSLVGYGTHPFVGIGLSSATQFVPVIIFWIVAYRTKFALGEVTLAALAVTVSAIGDTYFALSADSAGNVPFPSPADVGYLLFYPLMLAALISLVRRQTRVALRTVMLDSAVASLGAATVIASVLSRVFEDAVGGSSWLANGVALAYPLFDLVLVSAIVGIAASPSLNVGARWKSLVIGLAIFTAADVVYAIQENEGTYAVGTPLDAGWALGLLFIAWWGDGFGRLQNGPSRRTQGTFALSLPGIAFIAGLVVLMVGTQVESSIIALILAGATVGLAAVPLVFRQTVLHRESRTDHLTGLLNRRALNADGPARLAASSGAALMLLDLDKFKEVNDSLGHEGGDKLLIEVSARLEETLRTGDLLARLGGDEFAILLEGAEEAEAVAVASKIRARLADPFSLGGITLRTSVSMGIALYPAQGTDLSSLLRRADMSMYRAKVTRDGHHVFTEGDDESHGESRMRTIQELRVAMIDDQLELHYQPKINLKTGKVTGVEALVRWNHPTRGLLPPDAFIRLVEESGLMPDMTQVVLTKSLDQARTWRASQRELTVAVNMSASSLVDVGLPARVTAMLAERELPASTLILEITEDFLVTDKARARRILNQLSATGVQIAVDDFGTGYSSLSYLRDLPINELKLDRSFVTPMADDARAAALVASTVGLAHSLGLRMVAEGVEDAVAFDELARYGCDLAQGFYMSRPVPAADLDEWFVARGERDEERVDV